MSKVNLLIRCHWNYNKIISNVIKFLLHPTFYKTEFRPIFLILFPFKVPDLLPSASSAVSSQFHPPLVSKCHTCIVLDSHSTLQTAHCTLHTAHFTLFQMHTALLVGVMCSAQSRLHSTYEQWAVCRFLQVLVSPPVSWSAVLHLVIQHWCRGALYFLVKSTVCQFVFSYPY